MSNYKSAITSALVAQDPSLSLFDISEIEDIIYLFFTKKCLEQKIFKNNREIELYWAVATLGVDGEEGEFALLAFDITPLEIKKIAEDPKIQWLVEIIKITDRILSPLSLTTKDFDSAIFEYEQKLKERLEIKVGEMEFYFVGEIVKVLREKDRLERQEGKVIDFPKK